jgi:ribosomal protein S21
MTENHRKVSLFIATIGEQESSVNNCDESLLSLRYRCDRARTTRGIQSAQLFEAPVIHRERSNAQREGSRASKSVRYTLKSPGVFAKTALE